MPEAHLEFLSLPHLHFLPSSHPEYVDARSTWRWLEMMASTSAPSVAAIATLVSFVLAHLNLSEIGGVLD